MGVLLKENINLIKLPPFFKGLFHKNDFGCLVFRIDPQIGSQKLKKSVIKKLYFCASFIIYLQIHYNIWQQI